MPCPRMALLPSKVVCVTIIKSHTKVPKVSAELENRVVSGGETLILCTQPTPKQPSLETSNNRAPYIPEQGINIQLVIQ